MILKRILWIFTLTLSIFTLAACGDKETKVYDVTLESNIEEITPTLLENKVVDGVQSYVLFTYETEGYTFEYWHIVGETDQLSTELSFSYTPKADVVIEAYYIEEVITTAYTVTVTSNVESINVTVNFALTSSGAMQYELIAPVADDFSFLYWMDINTQEILSTDQTFAFVAEKEKSVEAIYELIPVPVPTLAYETEFDDATKDAYALGTVSLSGETWTLSDALLGNLPTDLKISGKSVRIRDGYIQTEFSVSDVAQVIFYAGTYGSDANATVRFEVSTDKTTWTTVDTFEAGATLEQYSYVFDDELFTSLSISPDSAYYFRIVSEEVARTNIDDFQIYTGVGFIGDNTPLYTITFTEDMKSQYLIGETVDLSGCIATHTVAGATTCDVIGSVNTTIAGMYKITFYKVDEYDNTASIELNITVIDPTIADINMDMDSYYDDAEGLYGDALMDALHTIINDGFVGVTYGEARYILNISDQDPSNSSNVILVYLGTSVSGTWDFGATWNREHVWPQSLLGESADNGTVNMASDLYNLMPADPGENSSRGNSAYSELGLGYEPRDEVKGDVARAILYMMIMYDELDLVNTAPGVHEMGYLDELLAWHYGDPVDAFELARLEVIFGEQLNRNPFVDYPHLVELIWHYDAPAS